MVVLVTGGAGFIGSNFIEYWLAKYPTHTVVCYDKLTYAGNMSNLDSVRDNVNFHFCLGDICDQQQVEQCFDQYHFDMVVNFAAESHVDNSIDEARQFVLTNVLGVSVLLDACKKFGVGRFHQISTDEVYGDVPIDSSRQFVESDSLNPSSPYASTKASADVLALSYYKTHGIPVTISRCTNNYGKHQHNEKLIAKIIDNANNNVAIPIYGSGDNVRNWIHVLDHCSAVGAVLEHGDVGQIYNIASPVSMSNVELASKILALMGKDNSLIEYVKDRAAHDRKYSVNCNKIISQLGWQCCVDMDKALAELI